jgi:hypothetical protein
VKKIYFLSGYSRAGNTFLSSILNQNKNITVTPNSCVVQIMYSLFELYKSTWIKNVPEVSGLNNVINNLFKNYYEHIDSEFIFERGGWGTPYNLNMLEKLNYKPKFLLLVRPLVEVLASYVKVQKPKNPVDLVYDLMHPDTGKIYWDWQSTSNIIKTNQNYLLIKYDDFEIPEFKHRFKNIEQFTYNGVQYNDTIFEADLHKIKSEIKKDFYDVEEYLPKDIIKRYEGWDYF